MAKNVGMSLVGISWFKMSVRLFLPIDSVKLILLLKVKDFGSYRVLISF